MMPFLILGLIALFSGVIARSTVLSFWGGFFLQLFLTVVSFSVIGPLCLFPGVLFILLLARYQKRARQNDPHTCPFSPLLRKKCQHHFQESTESQAEGECAQRGWLKRKSFFKRNETTLSLLAIVILGLYLTGDPEGENEKKKAPGISPGTSPSVAAR